MASASAVKGVASDKMPSNPMCTLPDGATVCEPPPLPDCVMLSPG
jgi:hypothetical protein